MQTLLRWLVTTAVVVVLAGSTWGQSAADGTVDLSQEYTRKSMIFFKTSVHPNTAAVLTAQQITSLESTVRHQIESLRRFETIRDLNISAETPEEFVRAFQNFLSKNATDIARIRLADKGLGYDFEYADTVVSVDDLAQVMNSGYAYTISLGAISIGTRDEAYQAEVTFVEVGVQLPTQPAFQLPAKLRYVPAEINPVTNEVVRPAALMFNNYVPITDRERAQWIALNPDDEEWTQAIETLAQRSREATPQRRREQRTGRFYVAQFPVTVQFFGIRVVDEANELVPAAQAVRTIAGGTYRASSSGEQGRPPYLLVENSEEWNELMERTGGDIEALRRDQQQRDAAGQRAAINGAAQDHPAGLGGFIRGVDEFKIRDGIMAVLDDGNTITMRSGRAEDLRVDGWLRIYAPTEDNRHADRGWAKIRRLGVGNISVAQGTSGADSDQTRAQVIGGQAQMGLMLEEYYTAGVQIDLYFGWEFLQGYSESNVYAGTAPGRANQIPGNTGYFTLNLYFGYDLGQVVEIPELWIGFDAQLGLGTNLITVSPSFVLKKKFYFGPFALDIGVAGGVSFFFATGTEFRDIAFHILANVGDVNGVTVPDPTADSETASATLRSDPLVFFKLQPRFSYFFSPHFEIFVQLQARLTSGASSVFAGNRSFDGVNFPHILGFNWKTFGFGAELGLSFFF